MATLNATPEAGEPGDTLRAAREAINVTTLEVAEALNLPVAVIEGIEANAHDRLPAPVFTRGYIRSYAKLLELDGEALLGGYTPPEEPVVDAPMLESPAAPQLHRNSGLIIGGAAVAGILVILVVLTAVWPSSDDAETAVTPALPSPVVPGPSPASGSEPEATAESAGSLRRAPEALASPPVATAPSSGPGRDEPAPVEAVVPDTSSEGALPATTVTPPATTGTERRLTPDGDDRLVLSFREECWVQIKSAEGANLYSALSRADSELRLIGAGPFRLVLGYAPGATVSYNGEQVPLAPYTRNNVAAFVVGQ